MNEIPTSQDYYVMNSDCIAVHDNVLNEYNLHLSLYLCRYPKSNPLCCIFAISTGVGYSRSSILAERRADVLLPYTSPTAAPQPFLPLLAPSPLTPFTNSTIPKLSGLSMHFPDF